MFEEMKEERKRGKIIISVDLEEIKAQLKAPRGDVCSKIFLMPSVPG